ncbi:hypothetical protein [Methanotorris igneus]|uniref:Uncharacterized protein n=1 Tax=Methanotorris igneus (strain DSM 5666 / JCM 11834 / Kol 5) TaxID=880724 RepID=F6BC68_METIK|nr:hypothetical protein [Methanotorris igneus]AEF97274.1 hypothetical protein Metig_1742 [Methanotorris igneus Kol 5]
MCQGNIGIFRGFVYKNGYKIPLIEINGNISEIPLPITKDVKFGDRIMVYNSYNFEYEFEPLELKHKLLDVISAIKEKLSKLRALNSHAVYLGE